MGHDHSHSISHNNHGHYNNNIVNRKAYQSRQEKNQGTLICEYGGGESGLYAEYCYVNSQSPPCRLLDKSRRSCKPTTCQPQSQLQNRNVYTLGVLSNENFRKSNNKSTQHCNNFILDSRCIKHHGSVKVRSCGWHIQKSVTRYSTAGSRTSDISCLGNSAVVVNDIKLQDSIHFDRLHDTLVSIGHVWDPGKGHCVH